MSWMRIDGLCYKCHEYRSTSNAADGRMYCDQCNPDYELPDVVLLRMGCIGVGG